MSESVDKDSKIMMVITGLYMLIEGIAIVGGNEIIEVAS